MKIVVGLGNPGEEYVYTRHNIGFMVVERLAEKWGTSWEKNKKVEAQVSSFQFRASSDEEGVYLLKPQTYMNRSGEAVKKVIDFYKLPVINHQLLIFVVHDEIDLELGRLRIQVGGGSAGHKGVESVQNQLQSKEFVRFRMGIGRPINNIKNQKSKIKNKEFFVSAQGKFVNQLKKDSRDEAEWVLEKFGGDERDIVERMIERCAEAVELSIREGVDRAMNEYNG